MQLCIYLPLDSILLSMTHSRIRRKLLGIVSEAESTMSIVEIYVQLAEFCDQSFGLASSCVRLFVYLL
jgi:hypothetical protein